MRSDSDGERFGRVCQSLLSSVLTPGLGSALNYASVATDKKLTVEWMHQQRKLLLHCVQSLNQIRPEVAADHKFMMLYLNMILTFTNVHALRVGDEVRPAVNVLTRKLLSDLVSKGLLTSLQILLKRGLCRNRSSLSQVEMSAIVTIAMRPLTFSKCKDDNLHQFLVHIISVPALTLHLRTISPNILTQFTKNCPLQCILTFLSKEANIKSLFSEIGVNYGLCLVANVVHLSFLDLPAVGQHIPLFTVRRKSLLAHTDPVSHSQESITRLLGHCQSYVSTKQSNSSHWHMILGWFNQKEDAE